ncbi:MAG: CCA tRNA nucleotidyltransferase [Candidatus Sumerlaeia bacterium]
MSDLDQQLPPWPESALARTALGIVRRLQEGGHEGWFVGGAVRDWLLGEPLEDIDIATSAQPEVVQRLFPQTRAVGAHFGVVLVMVDGHTHEVATFRAEGSYVDRRRPESVRYGTLEEDWPRRDFTINAMYYDPVARRLLDPAGGRGDIERRRLATVGNPRTRFGEDALRLMRAVRFAARYGFEIEPETARAIKACAPHLKEISAERVADELIRIMTGPNPGRAMRLMSDLGLWAQFIPEIEAMRGCEQPANFHPEGDVFVHTALVLDSLREAWPGEPPPELALAALLHDVGKPPTFERGEDRIRFPEHQAVGAEMADAIGRRLKLSGRMRDEIRELVAHHMRFMDVRRMKRSTLRRLLGRCDFDLHLALHKADCLGSHNKLDSYEYCHRMRREIAEEDRERALIPAPFLDGKDLIDAGLRPGPAFGDILHEAHELQLEGELASRDEALAWLKRRAERI